MSKHQTPFKIISAFAALSLLTGCAVWTGGLPPSYGSKDQYPIVASVHGIKETKFSDDLHKIVTCYSPADEIVRNTNTIHAWIIHLQPAEKPLQGREYYILPTAARWGTKQRPVAGKVSLDQTFCVTEFTVPKGAKYISDEWGMFADDPLGDYRIAIFLDNKPAADFKFRVIEGSKTANPPKDQTKPSP